VKGHLNRQELQHFIERKIDPSALLDVDEHLASCEICGAELDELLHDQHPSSEEPSVLGLDGAEGESHPKYEILADYADGNSNEVDREIVDVHLAGCTSCSAQISELRILRAQIASGEIRDDRTASRGGWWRMLVPAAAVLLLGLFAWLIFIPRETNPETAGVTVPVEELTPAPNIDEPANANGSKVDQGVLTDPISDGGRVIGLNENGELVGLDVSREVNDKLTRVLKGESIEVPRMAKDLATQRGVLMGDGDGVAFSLKSPVGKVIETDRPILRWEEFKDAESYEVNIFDESFNEVASSGKINTPSWTASPLPRGKVFQWQVTATKDGVETRSPVRPAPDARFMVISADAAAAIKKARSVQPRSNLLLGIAYAEAGMIDEAKAEFSALAKKNPNSATARRLLRILR
jgi:hypothetical protein